MFLEGESLSINKGYLIKYILKKKSYREIIMLQPTNFRKVCEDQFCTKRFLFQMLTETKKKNFAHKFFKYFTVGHCV